MKLTIFLQNKNPVRLIMLCAILVVLNGPAIEPNVYASGGFLACGSNGQNAPVSDDCLNAQSADTKWRYVGISSGQQCLPGEGWVNTKLFNFAGFEAPDGLGQFCLYQSNQAVPNIAALENLRCSDNPQLTNCLSKLDPDSASIAPMSSDSANLMWNQYRDFFQEQVGSIDFIPDSPQRVRLSVIDTEPSGFNQDRNGSGTSQHGYTLLNIARDTLCPTFGSCGIELNSQLGLPLQRCNSNSGFCLDAAEGGYLGTISQLAQALVNEVEEWRSSSINHLVVNLSVAWDAIHGDDDPVIGDSRVAVQTMYRALQYASCRGAIVISASGNRVTGPLSNQGPLLPGGWEDVPAPSEAMCMNYFSFQPNENVFSGSYRPLVYAASAIKADGSIAGTRIDGEARLAAFGDHAVAPINEAGLVGPSQVLTGSSVATMVVSAAAAASWYFNVSAGPHDIMQSVYDSGSGVGRTADFCNTSMANCSDDVRRISICAAVDKACSSPTSGQCPAFSCQIPDDIRPGIAEEDLINLFAGVTQVSMDQLNIQVPISACRPGYVLNYEQGTPMGDPCPHLQYMGMQATPWTDGQPEGDFCPTCTDVYHSPGRLYLEIDSTLDGVLEEITLICSTQAYRIPGQLSAGSKLLLTDIPEFCEVQDVAVAFRLPTGGNSPASVASTAILLEDRDEDDIQDGFDNCVNDANPQQIDGDSDGIGNICDADYNQDCQVNFLDLFQLSEGFLTSSSVLDLTGDGFVNFLDFSRFSELAFQPPGISGFAQCEP